MGVSAKEAAVSPGPGNDRQQLIPGKHAVPSTAAKCIMYINSFNLHNNLGREWLLQSSFYRWEAEGLGNVSMMTQSGIKGPWIAMQEVKLCSLLLNTVLLCLSKQCHGKRGLEGPGV